MLGARYVSLNKEHPCLRKLRSMVAMTVGWFLLKLRKKGFSNVLHMEVTDGNATPRIAFLESKTGCKMEHICE